MTEQVFVDSEKQLIVALSPELLSYNPVGAEGWRCRTEEIRWTSSLIEPRGVREVRLHGGDGRAAFTVPEFEQIERFYLALVRQLGARPFFDSVRDQMPTRVDLLERVLWLAEQTAGSDGAWEALQADEGGIVAAAEAGLVLAPPAGAVERIPWNELAGTARREVSPVSPYSGVRFFRADSWLELALPALRPELAGAVRRRQEEQEARGTTPRFSPRGIDCADPRLALESSWEVEAARDDGLFEEGERVVACVCGRGRSEGGSPAAEPGRLVGALGGRGRSAPLPATRVVLFLTQHRLLITERDLPEDALLDASSVPVARAPRVRLSGATLLLDELGLETDLLDAGKAAEFVERYRQWVRQGVRDPFSPEVEPAFR